MKNNKTKNTSVISNYIRFIFGEKFHLLVGNFSLDKNFKDLDAAFMLKANTAMDKLAEQCQIEGIIPVAYFANPYPYFLTASGDRIVMKGFEFLHDAEYFPRNGGQITTDKLLETYPKTLNGEKCTEARLIYEQYKDEPNSNKRENALKKAFKMMVFLDYRGAIFETLEREFLSDNYTIVFGQDKGVFKHFIIDKTKIDMASLKNLLPITRLTNVNKHHKKNNDPIYDLLPDAWKGYTNIVAYIDDHINGELPKIKLVLFSCKTHRDSCNISFPFTSLIYFLCPEYSRDVRAILQLVKIDHDEPYCYIEDNTKRVANIVEQLCNDPQLMDSVLKQIQINKNNEDADGKYDENDENDENDEDELSQLDMEFPEGRKIFKRHLESERNRKLSKEYHKRLVYPVCKMCGDCMHDLYPELTKEQAAGMIDGHHPYPVADGERITKLSELVALCPRCHRAIHRMMANFFRAHNIKCFEDREQADKFLELALEKYHKSQQIKHSLFAEVIIE